MSLEELPVTANRSIPSNAGATFQAQSMPNQIDLDQIAEIFPQS
jgi:hypothetical protein